MRFGSESAGVCGVCISTLKGSIDNVIVVVEILILDARGIERTSL